MPATEAQRKFNSAIPRATKLVRATVDIKDCGFGECSCRDCDTRRTMKLAYQDKLDYSGFKSGEKVVIIPSDVLARIEAVIGREQLIQLWNL